MSVLIKVALSAGVGTFLAEWIEPKLAGFVKPDSDFAKKALKGASAAAGAAGVYWLLSKIG